MTKEMKPHMPWVVVGANEILRVTADGQFVWNADADRMIKEGDFSFSPALPHILSALRKREWVGLTDEEMSEAMDYWSDDSRSAYGGAFAADGEYVDMVSTWRYIEAKLKEKNT